MNKSNNVLAFALVGLAAGTIAWLLLGTKAGRQQLDGAAEGFREVSDTVKRRTKKGMETATAVAGKATKEANNLRQKATSRGKSMLNKANQAAKETIRDAEEVIKAARHKTDLS